MSQPVMTVETSRLLARLPDDRRRRVLERAAIIRDGAGNDDQGNPRMTWVEADQRALELEGIKQPSLPGVEVSP